jgi:hypothetical protein
MLMMGGRSLASVPWPLRFLARRRGGSLGSRWGGLLFPRVLVQVVGLKRGAGHHLGWCGIVQGRLHALAQRVQLRAGPPPLTGSARGGFPCGDAAPQEDQRGGALAGLFKDGVGQARMVAVTRAATVGREIALRPQESALGAMTVRAGTPLRMQVTLQPDEADAVIQQFGNRDINHISRIPHSAR